MKVISSKEGILRGLIRGLILDGIFRSGYNTSVMLDAKLLIQLNGELRPINTPELRVFALGLLAASGGLPDVFAQSPTTASQKPSQNAVTPSAVTRPLQSVLPEMEDDLLLKGHKRTGPRLIDYANTVGQSLIGRKFNVRSLTELMMKSGWPTTAKDMKTRIASVRAAIREAPEFVALGEGVYTYDPSRGETSGAEDETEDNTEEI